MLAGEKFPGFWHLVRSFYDWDTYVALPFNIKIIDQLVRGCLCRPEPCPRSLG